VVIFLTPDSAKKAFSTLDREGFVCMAVGDEVKEKQDRNQKNTFYSVKRWVALVDYS
jgi:hypothetical protein